MLLRVLHVIFFSVAGLLPLYAIAQADWQSVGEIYSDTYNRVTLSYRLYNSCDPNSGGRPCKFKYMVYGNPRGQDFYVNWKMQYYNCNGTITVLTNSLNIGNFIQVGDSMPLENTDYNFAGEKLYRPFYNVHGSPVPDLTPSVMIPRPVSSPAQGIDGNLHLSYGEATTLEEKGGTLGIDAKWVWYRDQCGGNVVGEGAAIPVRPKTDTRYFVRAEGPGGITSCVTVLVRVDPNSYAADRIEGKPLICKGEGNVVLTVVGGKLGKNANWVWYRDSSSGRPMGTGEKITISPTMDTRYFVRAEGETNRTTFQDFAVQVIDERSEASKAIEGPGSICVGNTVDLTIQGGRLARDANWVWYPDATAYGPILGRGTRLLVKPEQNTTYYVRAEGVCNVTSLRSVAVQVSYPSVAPYAAVASSSMVYRGKKVQLSVAGGRLGTDARWVWYKGKPGGTRIGEGESVSATVHGDSRYYVRAEGSCNTTNAVGTQVYSLDRFWFVNVGVIANFIPGSPAAGSEVNTSPIGRAFNGQSFSVTFGHVKNAGWYLRGKYTFHSIKPNYTVDNTNTVTDYTGNNSYYQYNGEINENRWGVTGGGIFRLVHHALFMNMGVGYGGRTVSWGINEFSYANNAQQNTDWAKVTAESYTGAEVELGLLIRLPVLNLMLGANGLIPSNTGQTGSSTSQVHVDAYAGVGFNF